MKVIIAPNSFKGCLSASRVSQAIAGGVRSVCPEAVIKIIPLADGGDGLLDVCRHCPGFAGGPAFSETSPPRLRRRLRRGEKASSAEASLGGEYMAADTFDALARPLKAAWLKIGDMAVIELAQASGLARLKGPEEYNPLIASTFGTGILIARALEQGCREIVIGLGGSASVDAGCGFAAALGFNLLDKNATPIPPGGGGLNLLERISADRRDRRLRDAQFIALADVRSPLLGPHGAARLFGPQKGATPAQVEVLEKNLARWARIVERDLGVDVAEIPGAGAAGGAGAGCAAFLGAQPCNGAEWIGNKMELERSIAGADIVFTGEGRIDSQTDFGKIPAYVGRLAKQHGKYAVALGGAVAAGTNLAAAGIAECRCVTPPGSSLAEAFRAAEKNLAFAAARVMIDFLEKSSEVRGSGVRN